MADTNAADDFWSLDNLLPRKKKDPTPFASAVPLVDHHIEGAPPSEEQTADGKLSFTEQRGTFRVQTYTPKRGGLVRSITVKRYVGGYDFYDNFRKAAVLYFDVQGKPSPFVPFYSYMPQYSQMKREQKDYYFYFRSELRQGRFIKTDYSYIYLYVYEILNLPDLIPGEQGLSLLCRVWAEYRKVLPAIDKYFSVWIQDYCMVHALPPPTEQIGDFLFCVIGLSHFPEFYLSEFSSRAGVGAMIAYLSDYDYRTGKYAAGAHKERYRLHMENAMYRVLLQIEREGGFSTEHLSVATVSRSAFPCSLCTYSVKSMLEAEYYPIASCLALRAGVTAAVRYTENRLRAVLGVKSRLAIKGLPASYQKEIDGYFQSIFDEINRKKEAENKPSYEKQYDAPQGALSFAFADAIEEGSWKNTERLVGDLFSQEEEPWAAPVAEATLPETEAAVTTPSPVSSAEARYGLCAECVLFLQAALEQDFAEQGRIAATLGTMEDALAEQINEAFVEHFGDVVLEAAEAGYIVIEDYREEIGAWLWNNR